MQVRLLSGYWQFVTLPFDGGGGTSTTTVNVPGPSEQETEMQKIALNRMRRQEELEKQFPDFDKKQVELSLNFLTEFDEQRKARLEAGITPQENARIEAEQIQRASRMGKIEEELANMQLAEIKRGGKPTPEQLASINEAIGAAQKTGEADIERFRTDTLRQINQEIASASGLRPTDTPVVRVSERAGEEAARQQGMLTSRLAETGATARLNLPLASAKLMSDISSQQQALAQASQNFQAQLRARAEENRFRLFQAPISNQQQNWATLNPGGFAQGLAQQRLGMASRTTTTEGGGMGLGEMGQFAGGVGALIQGVRMFSDRRLKRNVRHIGRHACGARLYEFEYAGAGRKHVGVMADEVYLVRPGAVSVRDGYLVVDYAAL